MKASSLLMVEVGCSLGILSFTVKLEELFHQVKLITDPLIVVSKILKRQDKIEGERLTNLKLAIDSLSKAWRKVFE